MWNLWINGCEKSAVRQNLRNIKVETTVLGNISNMHVEFAKQVGEYKTTSCKDFLCLAHNIPSKYMIIVES